MDINRKVQNCQLDIAIEVRDICKKHGLNYFLGYGSLLGAVRHRGFIPWDDDLDICMPRHDYELFVRQYYSELSEEYRLITWWNSKQFGNVYSKIMIKGTLFDEEDIRNKSLDKGIFIDLFPIDNYPNGDNKALLQKVKILRFLLYCKCNYVFRIYSPYTRIMAKIIRVLLLPVPKKAICSWLERLETSNNAHKTDRVRNYNAETKGKDWFTREGVENLIEVPFEGHAFKIVSDYDSFLTRFYGDYMTPPPESERGNRHGIRHIDFGDYINKNTMN